jgi:hypothetical protein
MLPAVYSTGCGPSETLTSPRASIYDANELHMRTGSTETLRNARAGGARRQDASLSPSWQVGAWVSLVLALLVMGNLPVVHDHEKPGLYNEECPLARLAAGGPRADLSSSPDLLVLLRAPEVLPVAPRAVPAQASLDSFDPRAPPSDPLLPSRALTS